MPTETSFESEYKFRELQDLITNINAGTCFSRLPSSNIQSTTRLWKVPTSK